MMVLDFDIYESFPSSIKKTLMIINDNFYSAKKQRNNI